MFLLLLLKRYGDLSLPRGSKCFLYFCLFTFMFRYYVIEFITLVFDNKNCFLQYQQIIIKENIQMYLLDNSTILTRSTFTNQNKTLITADRIILETRNSCLDSAAEFKKLTIESVGRTKQTMENETRVELVGQPPCVSLKTHFLIKLSFDV